MALESIRNSYRGEHITIRFAERFETLDLDRVDLSVPSTLHCPHQKRLRGKPDGYARQLNRYFALTLDVIEVITLEAILNWSVRFSIPCRRAIQSKSV